MKIFQLIITHLECHFSAGLFISLVGDFFDRFIYFAGRSFFRPVYLFRWSEIFSTGLFLSLVGVFSSAGLFLSLVGVFFFI